MQEENIEGKPFKQNTFYIIRCIFRPIKAGNITREGDIPFCLLITVDIKNSNKNFHEILVFGVCFHIQNSFFFLLEEITNFRNSIVQNIRRRNNCICKIFIAMRSKILKNEPIIRKKGASTCNKNSHLQ